jgi:hypothetical protein
MAQNLDSLLNRIVTVIRITSVTEPVLYYSNSALTITNNGQAIDVFPYIVDFMTYSVTSVTPINYDAPITTKKPLGFKLGYSLSILYDVPKYYGAVVDIFIGSTPIDDITTMEHVFSGHIANVVLSGSNVSVTLTDRSIFLDKPIMEVINNRVVPIFVGYSNKLGTVPVTVSDVTYHVLCNHSCVINSVKDANGVVVPYTLIPYKTWTVILPDVPLDNFLVVEATNGTGTVGSLLNLLLVNYGFAFDVDDITYIDTIFPELVGLQLLKQMTVTRLISYILRATSSMWYLDFITNKVRILPYYKGPIQYTYDDDHIIYNNASITYKVRPYTKFVVHYALDYARSTSLTVEHVTPAHNTLPEYLRRDFGDVYTITNDQATAQKYADFLAHQYSLGLGVFTLKVNIYDYTPLMGHTIAVVSESMKINGTFIIEGITYNLHDLTYSLQLVTI